jgi:hypothetical protein
VQAGPSEGLVDQEEEIARLKALVANTEEIAGLEARLQPQRTSAGLAPGQDFLTAEELAPLEEARTKALLIQCVNNLKQFGLAVRYGPKITTI